MKSTLSLKVPPQDNETEVFIEKSLISKSFWIDLIKETSQRVALISDVTVFSIYGTKLVKALKSKGVEVFLFLIAPGEKYKTRSMKEKIEDQMLELKLDRKTAVISLGGGVVSDLAGFLAATYLRGVPFFSIPTTLMAQVDACLGGKVGVNTALGKNQIGAFYHPKKIFVDIDFLETLSQTEFQNGLSEVIKYALIASPKLFEKLQKKETIGEAIICECIEIKRGIVCKDPFETGLRRILNFGHTLGHAIETVTNFEVSHGKAIAFGMIGEAFLSQQLGFLSKRDFNLIGELFKVYGYEMKLPSQISSKHLIEIMKGDKKAENESVRMTLLREIGRPLDCDGDYCVPIEKKDLEEMVLWLQ